MDSKYLFDTISAKRLVTDKAVKGDVASLRYDFEVSAIEKMLWIPGKFNLADTLTKRNNLIEKSLNLTLYSGKISTDLSDCKENSSKNPTG